MRKNNQGQRRHDEPTNSVKGETVNFYIFLLRWERLQQVDMLGVGHFLGGRSQERRGGSHGVFMAPSPGPEAATERQPPKLDS